MGIIQWQLSDTWPGPSCSAIEYSLRPRVGWYHIKNAFKPIILRYEKDNGNPLYRIIFDSE